MTVTVTELRDLVGAVRCPTCERDTLPLPNGTCAWCDTVLTGQLPTADEYHAHDACAKCGNELTGQQKRFCSRNCRHGWWVKHTEAGQAWSRKNNAAKAARRRAARSAG